MIRRRHALVAATLAVALCAGFLSTSASHRLDHGSSQWHGPDAQAQTEEERTVLRFAFAPGRQVTFGASIRNPGPWPVTIISIAVNDGPAEDHTFRVTNLAVNHADEADSLVFDEATATPFRPVSLPASAELPVFVTITIPDVQMAADSSLIFDDLAVSYTVLGVPRHERVPMGFRLSVHSATGHVPR